MVPFVRVARTDGQTESGGGDTVFFVFLHFLCRFVEYHMFAGRYNYWETVAAVTPKARKAQREREIEEGQDRFVGVACFPLVPLVEMLALHGIHPPARQTMFPFRRSKSKNVPPLAPSLPLTA